MVDLATNKEPPAIRAAHFWSDYWPNSCQYGGMIVFSGMAILVALSKTHAIDLNYVIAAWLLGVALFVTGVTALSKRTPRISELKSQVSDLRSEVARLEDLVEETAKDAFDICDTTLANIANDRLGFSDHERISLYVHSGGAFTLQGRYSIGPNYNDRSRRFYPDKQGCIWEAWCHGSFEVLGLPDPDLDCSGYVAAQKQFGIEEDVLDKFRMKSRSYAALAIEDLTGLNRIAVLLVESTAPDGISLEQIERIMDNNERKRLAGLITKRKLPGFVYAKEEEF